MGVLAKDLFPKERQFVPDRSMPMFPKGRVSVPDRSIAKDNCSSCVEGSNLTLQMPHELNQFVHT